MSIPTRLGKAEARVAEDDFYLAAFDPVDVDGEILWRHTGSGAVYTQLELDAIQEANPGWFLYLRAKSSAATEALICETPPEEWTDEERAEKEAAWERMEEEGAAAERRVIRWRLQSGLSVEGFDDDVIAEMREAMGRATSKNRSY